MIAKAQIEEKLGNKFKVRIPLFESAGSLDECVLTATLSYAPGGLDCYNVGDVVFVAFENNQISSPVIIGKLYVGPEKDSTKLEYSSKLIVDKEANLPNQTTIGEFKPEEVYAAFKNSPIHEERITELEQQMKPIQDMKSSFINSIDGLNGGTLLSNTYVKGTLGVKNNLNNVVATLDQNGYVVGTWLKSTNAYDIGSSSWDAAWVSDSNGWLYKRNKDNIIADFNEYSINEKISGRWVDGKTIYKKTFIADDVNLTTGINNEIFTNTGIEATNVIKYEGIIEYNNERFSIEGWHSSENTSVYFKTNKINIICSQAWGPLKIILTVYYTKE